ncbi:MAG: glycosyltransferase family 2 protein [Ruminococcaceae bacterium]|nr:glycosyltransferase family 2 protein [Oscillospiraceae bacterium]
MAQPKVSIIVPVYNAEKYLERCINSLRNQTLKEIEIFLVDDSSTDASLALCKSMAQEDARIKVLHKENEGAGKARNAALPLVCGEYIGFVDCDDYVSPDMFEILYEKAQSYRADLVLSGVVYVGGNVFSDEGALESKTYFDHDTVFETDTDLKELRLGIVGARPEDTEDSKYGMSIWKNLFRTEIIHAHNLTFESERETLSEDSIFMVDYIGCIQRAVGIKDTMYHYCRNEGSISKSHKKDRFEKALVFVRVMEDRLGSTLSEQEYRLYLNRFWIGISRVICSQEILYSAELHVPFSHVKSRLKEVCTHPFTVRALGDYPIGKLPLMQCIFAYAMKFRMYRLMKLLVRLRNR